MNCRQAGEWLSPYVDAELDARRQAALEAHLAQCPRCSSELAALRRAVLALAAPKRAAEPEGLLAEFKQRLAAERPVPRRPWWSAPWAWSLAGVSVTAAAAAVFVSLHGPTLIPHYAPAAQYFRRSEGAPTSASDSPSGPGSAQRAARAVSPAQAPNDRSDPTHQTISATPAGAPGPARSARPHIPLSSPRERSPAPTELARNPVVPPIPQRPEGPRSVAASPQTASERAPGAEIALRALPTEILKRARPVPAPPRDAPSSLPTLGRNASRPADASDTSRRDRALNGPISSSKPLALAKLPESTGYALSDKGELGGSRPAAPPAAPPPAEREGAPGTGAKAETARAATNRDEGERRLMVIVHRDPSGATAPTLTANGLGTGGFARASGAAPLGGLAGAAAPATRTAGGRMASAASPVAEEVVAAMRTPVEAKVSEVPISTLVDRLSAAAAVPIVLESPAAQGLRVSADLQGVPLYRALATVASQAGLEIAPRPGGIALRGRSAGQLQEVEQLGARQSALWSPEWGSLPQQGFGSLDGSAPRTWQMNSLPMRPPQSGLRAAEAGDARVRNLQREPAPSSSPRRGALMEEKPLAQGLARSESAARVQRETRAASTVCPHCHHALSAGAQYRCLKCHHSVKPADTKCPSCGEPNPARCPFCHHSLAMPPTTR